MSLLTNNLRESALKWLCETNAVTKALGVRALGEQANLTIDTQAILVAGRPIPGLPSQPELVAPKLLKRRSMSTVEGRAVLIHALAHIEFNAINLALDAIWRFSDMPATYYSDWLKVAAEEAYHFTLLNEHLQSLGYQYGSFTGHNSLWEMVEKTQCDVLDRMALVPRTMEARGLDANPALRNKLAQAGDMLAADILDIILRDEISHVAIGNHWYYFLCEQRQLDPIKTFNQLRIKHEAPVMRPPFNIDARRKAGFSEEELSLLSS